MRGLLASAFVALLVTTAAKADIELFVSHEGNDAWTGRLVAPNAARTDGPVATLERARDEIRRLRKAGQQGGVVVNVRGGTYERVAPFKLTKEDSGSAEAPVVYRAYVSERVRLIGGKVLTSFREVSDPAVVKRLDPAARGHVFEADLKALGIKDFGQLRPRGFGRPIQPAAMELFFQGRPMALARWPNSGYVKITSVPDGGGRFVFDNPRVNRWAGADAVWLHGFWTWDWADSYERVRSIDAKGHVIATEPPHGGYGYKPNARFYVLNLLEELDEPGEWYLDRAHGRLYFWPPAPLATSEAIVSCGDTMLSLQDVTNVTIQGIEIEAVRGTAVRIAGGRDNRLAGCKLRNIGNLAVEIAGGTHNGVIGCDIEHAGDGGVSVSGGDRKTLTPAGNYLENCHIRDFSRWCVCYRPAVTVNGVGQRVANNLIHDAPHMAIGLSGNEHAIEYNEVHHVCTETDDAGAFYMGRDWTQRGNAVRYNYFHDIGALHGSVGVQAVYLDDWTSGTLVEGNICVRAGRGLMIGGGRDNKVRNNIFVDCTPAVHVDARGLGWAKSYFDGRDKTLTDRLNAVPYRQPPWSTRYPELLTLYEDEPAVPKGNAIERNICVGGRWLDLLDKLTDRTVTLKDNLVGGDPGFVDAAHGNFRVRDDSPALKLGFKQIPVEKIGLQRGSEK